MELDSLESASKNQTQGYIWSDQNNNKKVFPLMEVAYSLINAYCGNGNKNCKAIKVFKAAPEIFSYFCVIAEWFKKDLEITTKKADDQNNEDNSNSMEASKERSRILPVSDIYPYIFRMILELFSKCLCFSKEEN